MHPHMELRDPVTISQFQSPFKLKVTTASAAAATDAGVAADTANITQTVWSKLKDPLLDAATEVFGLFDNHPWRPETLWWNEQVDEAIHEMHERFKGYKTLKKGGKMAEAKEAETSYKSAKHVAKHAVWLPKSEAETEEFATVSPDGEGVFRISKHMDCTNQDVIGENCVRNDAGELALTDDDKMKAWVEHYAKLLNVEFELPSNELPSNYRPLPVCLQFRCAKHSARWNVARLLALLASSLRCWKLLVRKELSW